MRKLFLASAFKDVAHIFEQFEANLKGKHPHGQHRRKGCFLCEIRSKGARKNGADCG